MFLVGLIAADMDIFGRENLDHFIQNCFQKTECIFISDTEFTLTETSA